MMNFIDYLNTLIASNQPDKALDEIRKAFREYKIAYPDEADELNQLEQQIILHSARLRELDNKERNIQMSSSEIDVARSRMYSALLGIISSFGDYPELKEFLTSIPAPEASKIPSPPPQASFHFPPQARQPSPQPATSQTTLTKSSNKTVLGILGTVTVVALAALIYVFTNANDPKTDTSQLEAQPRDVSISPVGPKPEINDEDIQDQSDTEFSLWEEAKSLGTLSALEGFLEKYPDGDHAGEAKTLMTSIEAEIREEEEHLWEVITRANTVDMYNFYLRTTDLGAYNEVAEHRRDSLEAGLSEENRFQDLVNAAEADSLTVQEKLALWKSSGEDFTGDHLQTIQNRVAEAKAMIENYATITEDDNFVACGSVSENKNPVGIASTFPGPNVYMWARVNAPRSERLSVTWLDAQGNVVGQRTHTVSTNTGLGYRIFSMERFQGPGTYEVRLYNSQDALVAREVFKVE